jgi:hypothetical protein
MDIMQAVITSNGTSRMLGFTTNLSMVAGGLTVYAQQACFEPVPGGLSLSNAAPIQIAPKPRRELRSRRQRGPLTNRARRRQLDAVITVAP